MPAGRALEPQVRGAVLPAPPLAYALAAMTLVTLTDVAKSWGADRRLFAGVSLVVHEDERLGLIGANGSGKSTLLRALCLGFVGPQEAPALREDWSRWVTWGQPRGRVELDVRFQGGRDGWDMKVGGGKYPGSGQLNMPVDILIDPAELEEGRAPVGQWGSKRVRVHSEAWARLSQYTWGDGYGWFSSGFGPHRRFGSMTSDYSRVFYSNPSVARHLSAFTHEVTLTEGPKWLQERWRDELDGRAKPGLVQAVQSMLNDTDLLPYDMTLDEVNPHAVLFTDGNGVEVDVLALSDGYASVVSLTLELIRQMAVHFGEEHLFEDVDGTRVVAPPGVVMIDEVDAHLHPSWQTTIGRWFVRHFPNVQFIVATHSPLICRAIGDTGRVFRLRAPGAVTPDQNALQPILGVDRDKLRFGTLHRALESPGFGLDVGLSEEGDAQLSELARLNQAARERALSPEEQGLRRRLREVFSDLPAATELE